MQKNSRAWPSWLKHLIGYVLGYILASAIAFFLLSVGTEKTSGRFFWKTPRNGYDYEYLQLVMFVGFVFWMLGVLTWRSIESNVERRIQEMKTCRLCLKKRGNCPIHDRHCDP